MSIFGAVLAKVLADRKGLPPDVSNRFLITGYALGSVTSPVISAVVSERLAQQEADKLTTPTLPPSTPPPGTGQPSPDTAVIAQDYRGRPYSEVEKELKDKKINVVAFNVSAPGSDLKKGEIVNQYYQLIGQPIPRIPLEPGTLLAPNETVVFAVKSDEQLIKVPKIEGLYLKDARKPLEDKGFVYAEKQQDTEKYDPKVLEAMSQFDPLVVDQYPEPDTPAPVGSTVTVFYIGQKPGRDPHDLK